MSTNSSRPVPEIVMESVFDTVGAGAQPIGL
jgi:hypothetical protein